MNTLLIVGSIFAALAAVIHVLIFFMESIAWTKPATWKRFGLKSQAEAETVKPMAFNQGFYNLFLAIGAVIGVVMMSAGIAGGAAVTLFSVGCMLGAALVLILSSPKLARAAVLQGAAPLLAVAFLAIGLATA